MKKALYLLVFLLLRQLSADAQIRMSAIKVDDWIKKNFAGQGVVVGNIKTRGYPLSTLSFTSTPGILQVPKGLLLSSGNSFNVAGYNNSHNQSSTFGDVGKPETDPDLAALIKEKLFDICSVEFDFVPMDNSIQFSYQFGSDEYPEYVGSPYNDIFAFIISDETGSRNIALIPGTNVPVSINTVNHKTNQEHFIDNNLYKQVTEKRVDPVKSSYRGTLPGRVLRGVASVFTSSSAGGDRTYIAADPELLKTLDANLYRNLRYDGITKKLVAQTFVTPYKKYHLKIILADVSDNIYDSGVFIEDRSLTSKKDVLQPGFTDYPDLSKVIDPNLILQGKTLEEILPPDYKTKIPEVADQPVPATVSQAVPAAAPAAIKAEPRSAPVTVVPVLENAVIYFDTDKSVISDAEMAKLKEVIARYKEVSQYYSFRITGHTDSVGNMAYNVGLSQRRNKAVSEAVNQLLGRPKNLSPTAHSFTQPAADNATDAGRAANRRVEIIFTRVK